MRKIRLCSNDEGNLMEEMIEIGARIADLGISCGMITVSDDVISGRFKVGDETCLLVTIENDGDKRTLEYEDAN